MIATDSVSLVFIGCFAIGLLYLLITAFLGGGHHVSGHGGGHHIGGHMAGSGHAAHGSGQTDGEQTINNHGTHGRGHDVIHHAPGGHSSGSTLSLLTIMNPTTIILFLMGFGFFGYIIHNTIPFALPLLLILAITGGVILATLFFLLLNRIFGNIGPATVQDVADRTGVLGKVSLTVPDNGIGEILYISPGGFRKSVPARSVDGRRLERDQEVIVVNYQKGIAEVDTWEHLIAPDDKHTLSHDSDDLAALRKLLEETDKTDSTSLTHNDSHKE